MSDSQYFAVANVPGSSINSPMLESATNSSMIISWNQPENNEGISITGYQLFMSALDDGDWHLVYDGSGQPTIYVTEVSSLQRGMFYRFKTRALNYVGAGGNSTDAVLLCAATPSAPQ